MSLIIAEKITHAFGTHEVIRKADFRLGEAERVGLVGPNGEGKTTVLRIIGGQLDPTEGSVHRSRGLRIGYLPQDPPALKGSTINDAMLEVFSDLRRMENQLRELADAMASDSEDSALLKRYGAMQAEFEAMGGYDYHTRIERVLTGLAFERDIRSRPLSQLSGGQRTRAYLAGLLLQNPDMLMLDEPTNHLDLDSIEWLERWLQSFQGALIVVSHDRYFLDRVTANTWEIAFGQFQTYRGSYSKYIGQRAQRDIERMRRWQEQQEYIAKTQDYIARYHYGQRGKEARGRRTRLERFMRDEAMDRPKEHQTISLSLSAGRRTGEMVFDAIGLAVGYEPKSPLLRAERLQVIRRRRVAILGANGTGKTALLRTLLGEIDPLAGTFRHGANVKIGYLPQTHESLDPASTVFDAVMAADKDCTPQHARSVLGSLLISGDDAFKRISELSGGQRSRVVLAKLVVQNPNVLVLDEPTNHLDIPSTEILQDVLQRFDGSVIFVSHDRYLVQHVATDIWVIDAGRIQSIAGGWEDFLAWRDGRKNERAETGEKPVKDRKAEFRGARKQANLLQRLKRRHEELEAEIETVEAELAKLNDEISTAGQAGDQDRISLLCKEYPHREARLKTLWLEWEDVGEKLG